MKDALPHNGHHLYQVGEFQLNSQECALLLNGEPVSITPKMFDVLWLLVRNSGRIVGKDELLRAVWSDSFVEESNITVTIGQLRKVLGDDAHTPSYIQTIARRGYRLVAPVSEVPEPAEIVVHTAAVGNGIATEFIQEVKHSNGGNGRHEITTNGSATESVDAKSATEKRSFRWIAPVLLVGLLAISAAAVYIWKNQPRTIASRLTNLRAEKLSDTGDNLGATISPDGKLIAYSTVEGGQSIIWLRHLATGKSIQIVPPSGEMVNGLSFSNDGEYIHYFHSSGSAFNGVSQISILGGTPTKILSKVHGSYSFSPDGTRILFSRFDNHDSSIWMANADGSDERLVIAAPKGLYIISVDWAPDGNSFAYSMGKFLSRDSDFSVVEHDLVTGAERSLTKAKWNDIEAVMWLPDKSGLLVSGRDTVDALHQVWLINLPGGDARQLTFDSSSLKVRGATADFSKILVQQKLLVSKLWIGESGSPSGVRLVSPAANDVAFTRDGSIVFPSSDSLKADIWIASPDGTGRRQLTNNDAVERAPTVSPDDRFIVYSASVKEGQSIWRMDMNGENPIELVKEGSWPTFTPDGRFVVFNSLDGGRVMKVPIEGGEPSVVFDGKALRPSVSRDGISFAYYGIKNNERTLFVRKLEGGALLKEIAIPGRPVTQLQPKWTADGKGVLINATDDSKLGNLFLQRLDGSPAEKLTNFTTDVIFDFALSADGSKIAMIRGGWNFDAVLLTGID